MPQGARRMFLSEPANRNFSLAHRGWSQRRIARELGINRETVRRYLRLANRPFFFDKACVPAIPLFGPELLFSPLDLVVVTLNGGSVRALEKSEDLDVIHCFRAGDLVIRRRGGPPTFGRS